MKAGAKKTGIWVAAFLPLAFHLSCGNPGGTSQYEAGMGTVNGIAGFGALCLSGTYSGPKAIRIEDAVCPINAKPLQLAEPLEPLFFSIDCPRKTMTVRTIRLGGKQLDSTFFIKPDFTFEFLQDGLTAKLRSDGAGHENCVTPMSVEFRGHVDCPANAADKAKATFDTIMYLNPKPDPKPSPTPTPSVSPRPPGTSLPGNPNYPGGPRPGLAPMESTSPSCALPVDGCWMVLTTSVTQC